MCDVKKIKIGLLSVAFLSSGYYSKAVTHHVGVTGSLVMGPSWGTVFKTNTTEGQNARDKLSSALDNGYDFYNSSVNDATKVFDIDWIGGVYYTLDFESKEDDSELTQPALLGVDAGLSWFSKTNTINLASSGEVNNNNSSSKKFEKVDS